MKKIRDLILNNLDIVFILFLFGVATVFHYGKDDVEFMLYMERLDYFLMQGLFFMGSAFLLTCLLYSFITYEDSCKCHCCKGEK